MDSSFTDAEKRFILAEMMKQLDIGVLVGFLKTNGIGNGTEPDWFSMQLPHGRNLKQCMQAAEHMFGLPMKPPNMNKRKSVGGPVEHAPKRLAMTVPLEPAVPPAMGSPQIPQPPSIPARLPVPAQLPAGPNSQLVNIQPRLNPINISANTSTNGYPPAPILTPPMPTVRRRGRPSRSARSRELRPILPQHYTPLAPRTPTGTATGVPIAPAQTPTQETNSPMTPTASYSASPGATEPQKGGKRRGRPPSGDKAQPASLPTETDPLTSNTIDRES